MRGIVLGERSLQVLQIKGKVTDKKLKMQE